MSVIELERWGYYFTMKVFKIVAFDFDVFILVILAGNY